MNLNTCTRTSKFYNFPNNDINCSKKNMKIPYKLFGNSNKQWFKFTTFEIFDFS